MFRILKNNRFNIRNDESVPTRAFRSFVVAPFWIIFLFDLKQRTGIDYSIDEYVTWYQAIVILVHFTEQIRQTGFFVIHEFEEL